ncbi:MAG TPA: DUF975 family protein [Candidatus Paceibacterota bacterium]|nr:DUF975 family protein [Candidatus Paceibacterota bacterium]
MEKLSVQETITFGWNTFRKRPWIFVGVVAILFLVQLASGMLSSAFGEDGAGSFIGFVLTMAIGLLIGMGLISFFLKAHENVEAVTLKDLWHPRPFLTFLGTSILVWILVVVGLILLIVPGVIAAIALMFATYLVIDRGLGPIPALKESARLTKGNRWKLFLLSIALGLMNVVGMLLLFVGLFVTVPVSLLASAHAYRTLVAKDAAIVPEPSAEPA